MRMGGRLAALQERQYRLLFSGQLLSYLGDQMTPVAVTFAVLDRGGTAAQVGWVLAAGTATMVVFLLLGGTVADRLPRQAVMLSADLLRMCAQGAVAYLLLSGQWQVWEVAVLEGVEGVGSAFFYPAMTGLLPQLVSGEKLAQGNALMNLSRSVGGVAGPGLAGLLVAGVGPGWAIAFDAATFGVSALSLARLHIPPSAAHADRNTMLADLRQGWDEFRSRSWLWSVVAEFSIFHLLVFGPLIVLGALTAKEALGGASAWGTVLSAFAVGSLIGGVVALHSRPRRPIFVGTLATIGFVPVPALVGLRAPLVLTAVAMAIAGGGFALFGTLWDTTMQQQVPTEVLSRVSSYDWFGSVALLPAGYAIAGPLASAFGTRDTLYAGSVVMAVLVLAVLTVPSVRHLRALAPPATPGDRPG